MTNISPSTQKVIFLGGTYDKFSFAVWEASRKIETIELPSKFTIEFDNGKALFFSGEEADKMRDWLAEKARQ